MTIKDFLLILLAFFLPPVPVFYKTGLGKDLLINILLTFLAAFPGIIHSIYIIVMYPGPDPYHDLEHGAHEIEPIVPRVVVVESGSMPPPYSAEPAK
jgi:uncharacterized membrane protein YqaE (UPF0057 family)